jgi:hypothetical protein
VHKLRVFSHSSFCLGFYPNFSVLQNAIHEYTRVFLFRFEQGFGSVPYTFDTDSDSTGNIFVVSNYNFANPQASIQDVKVTKVAFSSQKENIQHIKV